MSNVSMPDNGISVLIGLESATTLEGLLRPLVALRGLTEAMLDWTLRRLGVGDEMAEEMRGMASLDEIPFAA